jgi:membrane associated rhomboid family serine protease
VSDTERDSGWSEQYAETGGWPPPAEGQRSYGPGTPPGDPAGAAPQQPADPTTGQWAQPAEAASQPDSGEPARPGQWGDPADSDHAQRGPWGPPADQAASGHAQPGPWGPPADQTGSGRAQPGPWDQPADPAGSSHPQPWGPPADQTGSGRAQPGPWGPPADQAASGYAQPGPPADQAGGWGTPANYGSYGQPIEAWAPGDPAYGRLGNQTPPPPPQQRPRRPWDGRPAPARSRPGGTAVVTITLIAICVVVYLIQQANPAFTARYALIPFAVEQGQYARLITSAFLHASVLHLATNMITLYIVGAPLERVLRPVRYLIVYFLSALGGSLFSVWLSPEFSIGVGASGAIFGLFGALLVLRRQVGAEAGALAVLIGLNLVISFTLPNISWQAHIGGLVTGTLVALALRGVDRISRRPAT